MGRLPRVLLCLAYAATPSDGFKIVDGVGVLPDPSLARAESPDGSAWIEIENPVTGDLLIPDIGSTGADISLRIDFHIDGFGDGEVGYATLVNDEGMGDVTHKGMGLPNIVPGIYNVTLVLCSKPSHRCLPDCSCSANPYRAAATVWAVVAPVDFGERNPMLIPDNFDELTMECRWWGLQTDAHRDSQSHCAKVVRYAVDTRHEL